MICVFRNFALAALTSAVIMPVAQASDGTVNFGGLLLTTTCTISVNGGTSVGTVTLPTLSTGTLAPLALLPVEQTSLLG